ncbi:hypothetical protein GGR52DRAFT_548432 [Hypoxylon sp. FL1284]|nr:hypothetical protein GGR52DRAFT_548432 [Hypoxylon sp. FL1284]
MQLTKRLTFYLKPCLVFWPLVLFLRSGIKILVDALYHHHCRETHHSQSWLCREYLNAIAYSSISPGCDSYSSNKDIICV